jgi:O-antigen/teichoic acid export membrane protein
LIGFFTSLQVTLSLLDLGFSSALNRELARLSSRSDTATQMRNLTRTLEITYLLIAVTIALVVLAMSRLLASTWLEGKTFEREAIGRAINLMGLGLAARWPSTLYMGALMGLQRQVLLAKLKMVLEAIRSGGAALVLLLVAPTLYNYLAWQILSGVIASGVLAWATWAALPQAAGFPRFILSELSSVWNFAVGLGAIAVTVLILNHMDRVVLSGLVDLEALGYYTLAWAVAGVVAQASAPVFATFFPLLTQAVARNDPAAQAHLYHRACQVLAAILIPVGMLVIGFARELLLLWTQNEVLAETSQHVLRFIAAGVLLSGLASIPYALQLAHGWTTLALRSNIVAILALLPALITVAPTYGTIGAASLWVLLQLSYLCVNVPIMHRRILPKEIRPWLLGDVLKPLVITCAVVATGMLCLQSANSRISVFLLILATWAIATLATAASLPHARELLRDVVARGFAT